MLSTHTTEIHPHRPPRTSIGAPESVTTTSSSAVPPPPKERFPDPNESGPALSLPVLLCLFISVAIAVSFITLFFVTQHYEQRTVRDLGEKYVSEVERSLNKDVQGYLVKAKQIARSYATRLTFDNTSWLDYEFHRRQLVDLVMSDRVPYEAVYFGSVSDYFIWSNSGNSFSFRSVTSPVPGCQAWNMTHSAQLINFTTDGLSCKVSTYRATQRPWFQTAAAVTRPGYAPPVWSDLYTYSGGTDVGTTVSVGLTIDGELAGVAAVDIIGNNIQDYVRDADVPKGTELFLADDRGYLVGTRRTDVPMSTNVTGEFKPIAMTETQHSELYTTMLLDAEGSRMRHVIGGTAYYTTQRKVPLPSDPYPATKHYTLHVAVPESSFTHLLEEGRRVAIGVTVGVGVACIMIIAVYVYMLGRPIARVAVDLERVANLELEEVADSLKENTRVSEVRRLRRSFAVLVRQLIEYRAYMPRSLLALVGGDGGEDTGEDTDEDVEDAVTMSEGSAGAASSRHSHSTLKRRESSTGMTSQRSFSKHSSARAHGHVSTAYAKTMNTCRASVLVMNLRDTHSTCRTPQFTDMYSAHMSSAVNHVQAHRGVPMFVFGDFLVSTFNAVKKCASKELSACLSAVHTTQETGGAFTIGISSGQALCGDVRATIDMRSFAVLGPCVNEAFLLQRLNRKFCTSVLLSGGMYAEASLECIVRLRDVVVFRRSHNGRLVALELVGARDAADEEWMYSLIGKNADPLTEYNEAAFALFSAGGGPGSADNFLEKYGGVVATENADGTMTEALSSLGEVGRGHVKELCVDLKRLVDFYDTTRGGGGGGVGNNKSFCASSDETMH
eukprot:PhM_4_TR18719/c1_g1_i10/m.62141